MQKNYCKDKSKIKFNLLYDQNSSSKEFKYEQLRSKILNYDFDNYSFSFIVLK